MSIPPSDAASKRFRVAFSFAGEKRAFVENVANILADRFGESEILYDRFHEAEFARARLGRYLPKLYHEESELVVVVICRDYPKKEWCGLEWDAIFDLLKKRREDEVMLAHFENATVEGLYSDAGFVELDNKAPAGFTTIILQRLALNEGKPKEYYIKEHDPPRPSWYSVWRWPILFLVVLLLLAVFVWGGKQLASVVSSMMSQQGTAPSLNKPDPILPVPPRPPSGEPVKIPPDVPKRTVLIRNETAVDIELFWFSYVEDKYFDKPYFRVRQYGYANLPALRDNLPDDQGYAEDNAACGWAYVVIRQKKTGKDYVVDWIDLGTEKDRTLRILSGVFEAEFEDRKKYVKKE